MPNYDYLCTQCGNKKVIFQKISEEPLKECSKCHQLTFRRGPGGGVGLHFHGSGFYRTDYEEKRSTEETPSPKETPSSSSSKGCGCGKTSCQ